MSIKVVFVCMGNICRSPMAEAVFSELVNQADLNASIKVDSCGTGGWHAGEPADSRTLNVLKKVGIHYDGRARQINDNDLATADYLIAMDYDNLAGIKRLGKTDAEVGLLLDYSQGTEATEVPDPYYNGNFEQVYELVQAGCAGLLAHIRKRKGI